MTAFNPGEAAELEAGAFGSDAVELPPLPTFSKVVFIVDLVLCAIRVLMVAFGFVGCMVLMNKNPNDPLLKTTYFEIGTGIGIVIFGLPGNILLLMRKTWAMILGYLNVVATLGSFGVGLWQASIQVSQFQKGTPEFVGAMIGAGFALIIRFALLALYIVALYVFYCRVAKPGQDDGQMASMP